MSENDSFKINPIGYASTPFKQKFCIPRQASLSNVPGYIYLHNEYANSHLFEGIGEFSHLWLLFQFHESAEQGWKNKVRAPRIGGNQTTGVFASRSPFRPNHIGMSCCKLTSVEFESDQARLLVEGIDLLDRTPIIDIKPYIPYADSIEGARALMSGENVDKPTQHNVTFKDEACEKISKHASDYPKLKYCIEQILSQDPRPAYKKSKVDDTKCYRVHIYDFDIHWKVIENKIVVIQLTDVASV